MERNSSDDNPAKKSRRKVSGAALLQPSVTAALHRALFEEWAETGYAVLRMDRIAKRAGVGKAALYRRWKSKRELAFEAVSATALTITPIPDTGSFKDDVHAITRAFAIVLRHPLVRRILPDLHAERARSDELADLIEQVTRDRRAQAIVLIERAIKRGELTEKTDRQLALDLLIAPLYWSSIVQRRIATKREINRIAKVVTASILCIPR
ncbi:MAG: TetR family transcriptional regulator [Hyphomicrobiales bacterium]|nr:MAG: TetR family transcriptional regulator [Hyphomicrobiales bacterium]